MKAKTLNLRSKIGHIAIEIFLRSVNMEKREHGKSVYHDPVPAANALDPDLKKIRIRLDLMH
jgi:hypothetical protein